MPQERGDPGLGGTDNYSPTAPSTGKSNFDGSLPDSVNNIDYSYLNSGAGSGSDSGGSPGGGFSTSNPSDNSGTGGIPDFYNPNAGSGFGGPTTGSGPTFGPSAPITDLAGAGTGAAASFAPTSGVDLGGSFPDPTSTASSGPGGGVTDFNSRFQPANDAVTNGSFDPQGAAYSNIPANPPSDSLLASSAVKLPDTIGNVGPQQDISQLAAGASSSAPVTDFSSLAQVPQSPVTSGGGSTGGGGSLGTSPTSTASSGGGSLLEKLAAGAGNSLAKNPLGIATAAGGLGLNMLQGNRDPEGLDAIRAQAANLQSTGSVLQTYLTSGTLPPGMQQSVDLATKAAKARIIGNYASRGMSTDPTKNSALQQELSQLDQNAIVTAATIGDKLMTQGLSATGMANQLYQAIMKVDTDRSKATANSIANFAAALGGGQTSAKIAA